MSGPNPRRWWEVLWSRLGPIRSYRIGIGIFVATVVIDYALAKLHAPGASLFFVTMLAILGTAWCGYLPGMVSSSLFIVAVPYLVKPGFSYKQIDPFGWATLLLISGVVSWVSSAHARSEGNLRRANDMLDERVRKRTMELQQANTELANRLAEIETLYRKLSLGVCFVDTDLRYVRVNEQLARWNGVDVFSQIGRRVQDILSPELLGSVEPLYRQVVTTGEPVLDYEVRGAARGLGEEAHDWLVSYTPVKNDAGTVIGVQGIIQDITDRKRFEEKLRDTAKLESLGVLAGGIAHDFNNLLTGIMGNASLARESIASHDPSAELLDDVVRASERAADLTRQLLAYAGKGRYVVEPVDVSALVRDVYPLVSSAIMNAADVRLDLDAPDARVAADASQLQQLIMNLIINAGEAIPQGRAGAITVRTRRQIIDEGFIGRHRLLAAEHLSPGEYLCFEVEDTGVGMNAATLERIFDPFFTTKFTGRGLGLSAVLGIVRSHRGALTVTSAPGTGATFRVYLPLTHAEASVKRRAQALPIASRGQLVLVVDDEEVVRRTASGTLERYGFRVLLASSGADAVELFRRCSAEVSFVILDLTMPGMDGRQTLDELRGIRPDIKVILSSGYDESDIAERFAGQHLAGFLQKPYTAGALISKLTFLSLTAAAD